MSEENLRKLVQEHPHSFEAHRNYALHLYQSKRWEACFIVLERAMALYEEGEKEAGQGQYFELKRLRQQIYREQLEVLMGPCYPLLDPRWMPIFKLGRPREMAWRIDQHNEAFLESALRSPQMQRLRFLSLHFAQASDKAFDALYGARVPSLRALSVEFVDVVQSEHIQRFFKEAPRFIEPLVSFGLTAPRIHDDNAVKILDQSARFEYLSLRSHDRSLMTVKTAHAIADHPKAEHLTQLSIVGSSIGDEGLLTLLTSQYLRRLQGLDLRDGTLSNAAARIVAADNRLLQLTQLDLRYNCIDPAGIDILSKLSLRCQYDKQHQRPAIRQVGAAALFKPT